MAKIKCTKCNNLIDSNVSFCPHCGEKNISASFYSHKYNNSIKQPINGFSSNPALNKQHISSPKFWSKKKKIIFGIIAVILVIGIIGAINGTKSGSSSRLVGVTWVSDDPTSGYPDQMILNRNGTCIVDGINGTWIIKNDNSLLISIFSVSRNYWYKFSGAKLMLDEVSGNEHDRFVDIYVPYTAY